MLGQLLWAHSHTHILFSLWPAAAVCRTPSGHSARSWEERWALMSVSTAEAVTPPLLKVHSMLAETGRQCAGDKEQGSIKGQIRLFPESDEERKRIYSWERTREAPPLREHHLTNWDGGGRRVKERTVLARDGDRLSRTEVHSSVIKCRQWLRTARTGDSRQDTVTVWRRRPLMPVSRLARHTHTHSSHKLWADLSAAAHKALVY